MTQSVRSRWALAGLSLSMLMPSLDTSIANVALPSLSAALGASFQQAQWIVLAYLLAITALIVSAGRLGDMFGRRRMLVTGIGIFTAASLLCGLAPSLWLLVAGRAAQGLGAAMMMSLTMALAGDTASRGRAGSTMGLLGTMSALGTTLGPTLGGVLIATSGWRAIFLVNVPLGILNMVVALQALPADVAATAPVKARFDGIGSVVLALGLAAYALGMTTGHVAFGLGAAGAGALLFAWVEARVASPLLPLSMFRNVALSTGLVVSALIATVMMATLIVGPFYLTRALALDAPRVGLVMSVGPLVAALAGVVAGRIVDRAGTREATALGLAGMTLGLLALGAGAGRAGVAGYLAAMVVITAHYALVQAANSTSVLTGVSGEQRGVTAGMLGLSRNLGLISGASAMGAVFTLASAADERATAASSAAAGMRATFIVAAALTGGALAALAIGHFVSHTGRHDPRVGHHRPQRRDAGQRAAAARGARDEALQPEVAPGTRVAAETDPAAA